MENERILMTKINMIEELLDNQTWDLETEERLKGKLKEYRSRLADLLLKD